MTLGVLVAALGLLALVATLRIMGEAERRRLAAAAAATKPIAPRRAVTVPRAIHDAKERTARAPGLAAASGPPPSRAPSLRRAMVWLEVLGPPRAIRQGAPWHSPRTQRPMESYESHVQR